MSGILLRKVTTLGLRLNRLKSCAPTVPHMLIYALFGDLSGENHSIVVA